jgi:hypothetical protein
MTTVDRTEALTRINGHRTENGLPRLAELPDLSTHCEECGTAYTSKDLDGGRCLTCGTMIASTPTVVQRIYVLSWAPSYDGASSGGCEWRRHWSEILTLLRDASLITPGHDYRIVALDLPNDLSAYQISEFLNERGAEVINPPDPRKDLADALSDWREEG